MSLNVDDEYRSIATVLDSLDALVYVADLHTHKLIFINQYGKAIWGEPDGRPCWKILQQGQTRPCEFCTNDKLLDPDGQPAGVYVWEFQNTITQRWYQCRDEAIRWIDGRLVRMEIATDITDRKLMEEQLRQAKEQAEALAGTDELTGLHNRRAFFEKAEKALHQARRFLHPLSVVMLDVDHFKQINDQYGHVTGDRVLQIFAQLLERAIRTIDISGRLGGEEFALVLPETDLAGAMELAERLRQDVANFTFHHNRHEIHISASIGVATTEFIHPQTEGETIDTLIVKADHALYAAKNKGRNRVEHFA